MRRPAEDRGVEPRQAFTHTRFRGGGRHRAAIFRTGFTLSYALTPERRGELRNLIVLHYPLTQLKAPESIPAVSTQRIELCPRD